MRALFDHIDTLPDAVYVAWYVVVLFLLALWNAASKVVE